MYLLDTHLYTHKSCIVKIQRFTWKLMNSRESIKRIDLLIVLYSKQMSMNYYTSRHSTKEIDRKLPTIGHFTL